MHQPAVIQMAHVRNGRASKVAEPRESCDVSHGVPPDGFLRRAYRHPDDITRLAFSSSRRLICYTASMKGYDPAASPPVAVTVDLVVLTIRDGALRALVVKRGEDPFKGRLALPGGFVRRTRTPDQA